MKLDSTLTGGSLRRCSIWGVVSFSWLDCLALIRLVIKGYARIIGGTHIKLQRSGRPNCCFGSFLSLSASCDVAVCSFC